ncbi:MAG: glycosyltransferase family 39 protein [Nitrospira sp.]|nr:glycosyltransferase family 39 protein [Nitrospira sp.]
MALPVATVSTDAGAVQRLGRASDATDYVVAFLLCLVVFGTGLFHLDSFPPLWFDEGWTVCVARTWVELGHYGCLLNGAPAPPSLAAHFPVVASIAASFHLFGIGIWQARMVGLCYTFLASLFLYVVARRTFNRPIALAALFLALAVPVSWQIHPLMIGRQVLGEMPMLCFLLAGYACVLRSTRQWLWLVAAGACWALAWMAKAQVAPFFVVSLAGTACLAGISRDWATARRSLGLLAGAWLGYRFLVVVRDLALAGHTLPQSSTAGMTQAIALVLVPSIRVETLQLTILRWPEYTAGLAYGAWSLSHTVRQGAHPSIERTVRTMLLLLAGSWLAWFALLCAGAPRYAVPGLFIAAPFAAALFSDLTGRFSLTFMGRRLAALVRGESHGGDRAGTVLLLLLLVVMGWVAVQERYALRSREDDRDLTAVIEYVHRVTPPTSLIETYDSELFLFLNRRYTYAPPAALVEMIQHDQNPSVPITYDPLRDHPDYLVVGDFGRKSHFYNPLINQRRIRLVATIGRYQIYQPVLQDGPAEPGRLRQTPDGPNRVVSPP